MLSNEDKVTERCHTSIEKLFNESGLHQFNIRALVIIRSDSDSAFQGENRNEEEIFQNILDDNNAVLEHVKLNDHLALGIIDAFAKQLKRILSKEFLD